MDSAKLMRQHLPDKPIRVYGGNEKYNPTQGLIAVTTALEDQFPYGFIPKGTLVYETTSGGENGFYLPYAEDEANVHDGQSAFDEQTITGVTNSTDSSDFVNGTKSAKIEVAATASSGVLASDVITSVDLTGAEWFAIWIKSSIAVDEGDLEIQLSETADLGGTSKDIDLPALNANEWTLCVVPAGTMTDLNAIISVGIAQTSDLGAFTLNIGSWRAWDDAAQTCAGILAEDVWFDSKQKQGNINGQDGQQCIVEKSGAFILSELKGYNADAKTDLGGRLIENDEILVF